MNKLLTLIVLCVLLSGTRVASANPVLCSPGYQDSTCVTPISRAPSAAPQCSTGAGWTTTSSPVWRGAYWSAPGCNYQAPPSCPSGYTQISGPAWNGSSWVGLNCQPPAPPPPPPPAGHVLIATTNGEAICQNPGTVNAYADGTYQVTNDFLVFTSTGSATASGTWSQMIAQAPSHRNMPTPISEPSDPNYAVYWLGQYYSYNNPWDCGGGVG